jgi:hypothetical protein
MCEQIDVIGETGIAYCSVPVCDQGKGCEKCTVYQKDAFTALAERIIKLQKTVDVYGELIDRLEKKVYALEHPRG